MDGCNEYFEDILGNISRRTGGANIAAWLDGDDHAYDHLRKSLLTPVNWERVEGEDSASDDAERVSDPERTSEAADDEAVLLETTANTVTLGRESDEPQLVVTCAGCRSWFCPRCCLPNGLKLRRDIKPILSTFDGLLMITLTVDPQAFDGDAEKAYRYVRSKRCISRLMRELRRRKLVYTDRWFSVVEWQGNGFAHYHVLVDASFIDHQIVHDIWNNFGPGDGRKLASGYHVRLGIVSCNRHPFTSTDHAAHYATKYLVKTPAHGFPKWVVRFQGRIRRFETSRHFRAAGNATDRAEEPKKRNEQSENPRPQRTIAEIVQRCGHDAALFAVSEIEIAGGEIIPHFQYLGRLPGGWRELKSALGCSDLPEATRIAVPPTKVGGVLQRFGIGLRAARQRDEGDENCEEVGNKFVVVSTHATTCFCAACPGDIGVDLGRPRLLDRTLSQTLLGNSPTAAEKTGREGAALPAFVESHPSPPSTQLPRNHGAAAGNQSNRRAAKGRGFHPRPGRFRGGKAKAKGETQ